MSDRRAAKAAALREVIAAPRGSTLEDTNSNWAMIKADSLTNLYHWLIKRILEGGRV